MQGVGFWACFVFFGFRVLVFCVFWVQDFEFGFKRFSVSRFRAQMSDLRPNLGFN